MSPKYGRMAKLLKKKVLSDVIVGEAVWSLVLARLHWTNRLKKKLAVKHTFISEVIFSLILRWFICLFLTMTDFMLNDTDTEVDSDEEVSNKSMCKFCNVFKIKNIFFFQLQEAFAKGLLKPGLNEEIEKVNKKFVNNVADLKAKLKEFKLKLPWVESLDLVTTVAPLAPDVALQLEETTQRRK